MSSKTSAGPPPSVVNATGGGAFGSGFDFGDNRGGFGGGGGGGGGLAPIDDKRRSTGATSGGEFREGGRQFGMAPSNPYGVNQFKSKRQPYDPDLAMMDPPSPKYGADQKRVSGDWKPPSPPNVRPARKLEDVLPPEKSGGRFNKDAQPKQFSFGGAGGGTDPRPGRQTQRLPLGGNRAAQP